MERREDWIRIAPIYQLEEGAEEVSQWVDSKTLSTKQVKLEGKVWLDVLKDYIEDSDNYMSYQEAFLDATTKLIRQRRCRLADFEEVGGWIKSINHQDNVYFTYCGGIETEHKIYLNVASGEVF
ncbi:SH3 domain protein [Vibrio maritimus]|uniref:SH3 domain protein n=1 Tax=Vibrio maritimus TaxID=990268 RepID=A0A090RTN2_9VIBR|nr:SH3 domain protein [Vibrio maritimus]